MIERKHFDVDKLYKVYAARLGRHEHLVRREPNVEQMLRHAEAMEIFGRDCFHKDLSPRDVAVLL